MSTPGAASIDASLIAQFDDLTRSQRNLLRLMAEGYNNSEIARRRGVTVSAVEQLVTAIYKKLNIPNDPTLFPRVEAVRLYVLAFGVPQRSNA